MGAWRRGGTAGGGESVLGNPSRRWRCVFLPPEGVPDDDGEEEGESKRGKDQPKVPSRYAPPDGDDRDVSERYDTWKARARRTSVRVMQGDDEVFLTAKDLNDRLRPDNLERLRYTLHPEEAFGNVFRFDGVVSADAHSLELESWQEVAREYGFPEPDRALLPRIYDSLPERIVERTLQWTDDWGDIKRIAYRQNEIYRERFANHAHRPREGIAQWLEALCRHSMPCCVYSRMDREHVRRALKDLGLDEYFTETVSAEDGAEGSQQWFLTAALKIRRPPQKCVAYEDSPTGVILAHDALMRCVALVGLYPAYELHVADATVFGLDELTVLNVRRLFADRNEDEVPTAFL